MLTERGAKVYQRSSTLRNQEGEHFRSGWGEVNSRLLKDRKSPPSQTEPKPCRWGRLEMVYEFQGVPPQWDFDFMWGASGGFTGDGWEKRLWQQRSGRAAEYEVHPVRSYTKSYSLNKELDSKSKCVTSVRFSPLKVGFGCSVYSRDFLTVFMRPPHLLVSFLIQED